MRKSQLFSAGWWARCPGTPVIRQPLLIRKPILVACAARQLHCSSASSAFSTVTGLTLPNGACRTPVQLDHDAEEGSSSMNDPSKLCQLHTLRITPPPPP